MIDQLYVTENSESTELPLVDEEFDTFDYIGDYTAYGAAISTHATECRVD